MIEADLNEKEKKAYELRSAGLTYKAIAINLSCSPSHARQLRYIAERMIEFAKKVNEAIEQVGCIENVRVNYIYPSFEQMQWRRNGTKKLADIATFGELASHTRKDISEMDVSVSGIQLMLKRVGLELREGEKRERKSALQRAQESYSKLSESDQEVFGEWLKSNLVINKLDCESRSPAKQQA